MPAVLNTNIASIYASKNLVSAQSKMADSVERLSSGLRINRAKDDAAGLAIANSLTSQINAANQGIRNINDGISLVQTAEGALSAASEMGQRILTLATQAANGTLSGTERQTIKDEMLKIIESIDGIADRTKFSENSLLTGQGGFSIQVSRDTTDQINLQSSAFANLGSTGGSVNYTEFDGTDLDVAFGQYSNSLRVYVLDGVDTYQARTLVATSANEDGSSPTYTLDGADYDPADDVTIYTNDGTGGLSGTLKSSITAATTSDAADFQSVITAAQDFIDDVGDQRAELGAYQNQLDYAVTQVTDYSANLSAARSRVMDTDYATETANLTKGQILQQAATAMLAQANQMPNVILSLLK